MEINDKMKHETYHSPIIDPGATPSAERIEAQ